MIAYHIPTISDMLCSVCSSRFHIVFIIFMISILLFHLDNTITVNNNNIDYNRGIVYAHIFSDAENSVTKNVEGRYQVSFLPYPAGLKVNDTSTKLNFSVMENNTDVPNLFTSLIIMDKSTDKIVKQTPYEFHEFGDVTYPYTFQNDGEYSVSIQAKIEGDPKYEFQPLMSSFDVSVQDMQKLTSIFQQIMLFYLTPVLAAIVGGTVYIQHRREKAKG
jgi:hypothetical protein